MTVAGCRIERLAPTVTPVPPSLQIARPDFTAASGTLFRWLLQEGVRKLGAGPFVLLSLFIQMLASLSVKPAKMAAALLIALVLMQPSAGNAQAIANLCTAQGGTLGANLLTNNGSFGTGPGTPGTTGSALPAGTTDYSFAAYGGNSPQDGQYSIVNRLNTNTFNYWFSNVSDHTTGAATGQMMVVNAAFAPGVFYRQTLTVTPNTNYDFSGWFLNLPNPASVG